MTSAGFSSGRSLSTRAILSLPFPSHLCATPDGRQAAWVANDAGRRNIWIANPADGDTGLRRITDHTRDDGLLLADLQWGLGSAALLYVAGSITTGGRAPDLRGDGEGAAPAEIRLTVIESGDTRTIAAGYAPLVSPAGHSIAFVDAQDLRIARIDALHPPFTACSVAGTISGLSWSPRGDKIAFASAHDGQSRIGVFDLAERSLSWIDNDGAFDIAAAWSADGAGVAFIRLLEPDAETYSGRPEGLPWSIRTAGVGHSASRCIWTAYPGPGSVFRSFEHGPALLWRTNGTITFGWERTGWLQLHSVDVATGAVANLTPGQGEIFSVASCPDRRSLLFSSNHGNLDGRRLWRLEPGKGAPVALTNADAVTDRPVACRNGRVFALQSSSANPLRPVAIDGDRRLRCLASPLPRWLADLAPPEQLCFQARDGTDIHAQLYLPQGADAAQPVPAIVHFHGGPARQMLGAWHVIETYHQQYGLNQLLVDRGFAVLSVNYRGGTGYGLSFREPADFGLSGASEYLDVEAAAHFLRGRAEVDPNRVGAYGVSYGGLLVSLGLARASHLYAAGVVCAGVADWSALFPEAEQDSAPARLARSASPVSDTASWRSPALLIHATDDRVVPLQQTIDLREALRRESDAAIEMLLIEREQHDLQLASSCATLFDAIADFFERKLGRAIEPVTVDRRGADGPPLSEMTRPQNGTVP